jgi:hypothetical protein
MECTFGSSPPTLRPCAVLGGGMPCQRCMTSPPATRIARCSRARPKISRLSLPKSCEQDASRPERGEHARQVTTTRPLGMRLGASSYCGEQHEHARACQMPSLCVPPCICHIGAEVRDQVRDGAGEREQGLRQDDGGVYRVLGGLSGGGRITENHTSSPKSSFLV